MTDDANNAYGSGAENAPGAGYGTGAAFGADLDGAKSPDDLSRPLYGATFGQAVQLCLELINGQVAPAAVKLTAARPAKSPVFRISAPCRCIAHSILKCAPSTSPRNPGHFAGRGDGRRDGKPVSSGEQARYKQPNWARSDSRPTQ